MSSAHTPYTASDDRYDQLDYARVGRSGLKLPRISLGLWNNFGDDKPIETQRAILRRAFDRGVTHFDLANNYGPPAGSAESNFGCILREDFRPYRDELIISSKAGYVMWEGPYGDWGSRKYLLSSLDASLARLGLDYVDIFYSHRPDPETPLEETMGALATAVTSGKALYAGISNYNAEQTREAHRILGELGEKPGGRTQLKGGKSRKRAMAEDAVTYDSGTAGHNLAAVIADTEKRMREAAANLEFEEAARLRDEAKRLREEELGV